jgi:hypothetical protein
MERWVSISEAEKILGLSRRTIWRKIESGDLESKNQGGKRFVLIRDDEGGESETELRPSEEGRKTKTKGFIENEVKLPTLTLIELLFDLKNRIRERTRVAHVVAEISSSFPNDGEKDQDRAYQWIGVLSLLEGTFQKIQRSEVNKNELQDLFGKFLEARAEAESLEGEKIRELETFSYEMKDSSDPELVQAIKEEKKDMDRDLDLFDQCINTIKKLIVTTQGGDE